MTKTKQKETTPKAVEETEIDMIDRDPYYLNSHVQTQFGHVIGEPEGAHSADAVWKTSYDGFEAGKSCCYTCLTYICAVPLAFCWGCYFSCVTFSNIWSITPCFRVFSIQIGCLGKFIAIMVHCCFDPCYESMALLFTKIYVNIRQNSEGYQAKTYYTIKQPDVKVKYQTPAIVGVVNANPNDPRSDDIYESYTDIGIDDQSPC